MSGDIGGGGRVFAARFVVELNDDWFGVRVGPVGEGDS